MTIKKSKILWVVPLLGGWRVLSLLFKYLDKEKFELSVVLYGKKRGVFLNDIPSDVSIQSIDSPQGGISHLPIKILKIARVIKQEKPDLIVSFLSWCNLVTIVASRLTCIDAPVIISQRNNLTQQLQSGLLKCPKLLRLGVKALYPYANGIISVSKGVKDDLVKNYKISERKVKVIYNPIDLDYISSAVTEGVNHPWFLSGVPIIVTVGRLHPQKGYSYLLKAFAKVRKKLPCKLMFIGDGKEKPRLKYLAQKLGVNHSVAFLGFQKNPFKYMARSDVFILSSLWEGFPNVLMEAMACGVPIISTRCSSGPEELIKDGVNGLLIPVKDIGAMASAITEMIENESLRKNAIQKARIKIKEFDVKKKVKEYENYFKEVIWKAR